MLEAQQKKKKAHEASAIGKLQAFGHNVGKLVGTAESESEPESDVSVRFGLPDKILTFFRFAYFLMMV